MNTEWLTDLLVTLNIPPAAAHIAALLCFFLLILVVAALATVLVKKTLGSVAIGWIRNTRYPWTGPLLDTRFFSRIIWFVPLAIISISVDSLLQEDPSLHLPAQRLVMSGFVIVAVLCISSLLNAVLQIEQLTRRSRRSMLQGYADAFKIITYVLGGIFIISIFTGRSPWGIMSVLGGLTAIVLLIFKDSILGFVASLQISGSDLVRIGDWIEMPQYGADGDVISMSIHTVKVQNFDKTITTIPTYALVSSSFKNWRGMQESEGRRIKRPLYIDMHSIRFCDGDMLKKFHQIDILKEYLRRKEEEITADNAGKTKDETILNGRRQTNIGVFRAYIGAYLKSNSNISQEMTFLVRQLAPTDHGLPLEIYVFSKDRVWANYEAIQADIFDHLLAAAPEFGLRIYQMPSGSDLRSLNFSESRQNRGEHIAS